jgi:Flp pilus assembly protein TadB
MWFVYLVCVVVAYAVMRKQIKRLVRISDEYVARISLEAVRDLKSRSKTIEADIKELEEVPMPSELADKYFS